MDASTDLAGMVAIVTGASRGLGRAFALDLVASGADVTITARSQVDLECTAALADRHPGAFEVVAGEVTDPGLAARAVARTEERFGPVDLLVNNAGTMLVGSVAAIDLEAWWRVMDVTVRGPMTSTKAVLPGMRARQGGRIINISSRGLSPSTPTSAPTAPGRRL